MRRKKHIVFLTEFYPFDNHPESGVFVQQFVSAIAAAGVKCTVINPVKIQKRINYSLPPQMLTVSDETNNSVTIYHPRYLSFSNKVIWPMRTVLLTRWTFERAVIQTLQKIETPPDLIYGHFLYPSGAVAGKIGLKLGTPSIVRVGESVRKDDSPFWTVKPVGRLRANRQLEQVTGFIANSSLTKQKLMHDLGVPEKKIGVFPNGVDHGMFFRRDKVKMRIKYGFPQDHFIIAFVGLFTQRKGIHIVSEVLRDLDNVVGVFLGQGPIEPSGPKVIFKGVVPHEVVPEMLSAADAFVLPTSAEGSCNAIIEAMACGLPVITSDGEFNDDIVDDRVAIRVNSKDIRSLRKAIEELRDNPELRSTMAKAAIDKSNAFELNKSAKTILKWISDITKINAL